MDENKGIYPVKERLNDEKNEIPLSTEEINGSGADKDYDLQEINDAQQSKNDLKEKIIEKKVEEILHQSSSMMRNFKYLIEHLKTNAYLNDNGGHDEEEMFEDHDAESDDP
eukprot:TRINITY_DN7856_c0_g1_i1.p1 TRINITY_DN7856_c0_g1~~TRINITY_DN7856_c0_g1_i1.p1  ORF type:complete len:111 (-),score=33.88 TRINITY_DN7856_c0_g1_i1:121-453(-)